MEHIAAEGGQGLAALQGLEQIKERGQAGSEGLEGLLLGAQGLVPSGAIVDFFGDGFVFALKFAL